MAVFTRCFGWRRASQLYFMLTVSARWLKHVLKVGYSFTVVIVNYTSAGH